MSELPNGWISTTLGQLGEWSSGGTPSRTKPEYFGGDIPWVKTGDLCNDFVGTVDEHISEEGLKNSSAKLFPSGSLLVAMYGATIGETGVLTFEAATNQACAALIAKGLTNEVIPFVWKYLISKQPELKAIGQGGAQPNISQTILKEFPVWVPPLSEQRRIIAKIDSLSGKSKRARGHLDHVPRLVEKYKQAVLTNAFKGTRGTEYSLDDLTDHQASIRYGVLQPGNIKDAGVPLIRVCDLENGEVAWSELRRIAPEIDQQYANARVAVGDVLVSVVGTIGRVALVRELPEPANIARAVARIRPDQRKIHSDWLAWRLRAEDCQYQFSNEAREVARKTLNVSLIKAMRLLVPEKAEQAETVRRIETAFAWIDRLASEATSARKLIDHLDQAILSKAFRGELVPQDPNDEPAGVLLARIREEQVDEGTKGRRKRRQAAI